MHASPERRLALAWVVAAGVTLLYLVVDGAVRSQASTAASLAAVGFALVKLRIILREFMGVRHAPAALRTTADALVAVMGVLLVGAYAVGKATA